MVEEFVSFARMPAPEFKNEDIVGIVKKILFSEQVAHPDITYQSEFPDTAVFIRCDERQLNQVLTNLLKNAAEAIEANRPSPLGRGLGEGESGDEGKVPHPGPLPKGEGGYITVRCLITNSQCAITIADNGPGFPPDKISKLLEPYFTTRAKGGYRAKWAFAIVKKILDEHKATLTLENRSEGGALVTINFSPCY